MPHARLSHYPRLGRRRNTLRGQALPGMRPSASKPAIGHVVPASGSRLPMGDYGSAGESDWPLCSLIRSKNLPVAEQSWATASPTRRLVLMISLC